MRKYEAAGEANIHFVNNKIQALDLNITGMDIYHFHKHVNFLNTELSAHGRIILDLMRPLFKEYMVCEDSDFREYLT